MPPSARYTVRLPPALDTLVQARVRAGTPVTVLIQEALTAYLTAPAPPAPGSAAPLQSLADQVAVLTTRVDALERELTALRQQAATDVNLPRSRTLTPDQMAMLFAKRPRGTPIKELMIVITA